jgi:polysaccharide pyruvyl transferase WcaK-like protein
VLAGTLAALRRRCPSAHLTVASARPQFTAARHQVTAVQRTGLGLPAALLRATVVVWGGGQMLQNESSRPFLWFHLGFVTLALLLGKPVICYAQGVGAIRGGIERRWARWALGRLAAITVRDETSRHRLTALTHRPVAVAADPAFCVEPAPPPVVAAALAAAGVAGRPFIAVALRRWGHYTGGLRPVRWRRPSPAQEQAHRKMVATFAAGLARLTEESGAALLLVSMCPGGDQGDDAVADDLERALAGRAAVHRLPVWLPAPVLKGALGRADLVVAMRTHAGMLAADAGTAVVSLSYQGKGVAFMERLGMGDGVLLVEAISPAALDGLLQRGWRGRADMRARAAAALPALRQAAWNTAAGIPGMGTCVPAAITAL